MILISILFIKNLLSLICSITEGVPEVTIVILDICFSEGFFCAKHGFNSLPTDPKIVSLYLTYLSKNFKIENINPPKFGNNFQY